MPIETVYITDNMTVAGLNSAVSESAPGADILLLSKNISPSGGDAAVIYGKQLSEVLGITEKHAVVYAQETQPWLFDTARKYLPLYSISVKYQIGAVLIRRQVIDNFGFLDCAYKSIKYALIDFCLRINDYGYTTVTAHRVLYFAGGSPGSSEVTDGVKSDRKLFKRKYRSSHRLDEFHRQETHPCISFLELLCDYGPDGQAVKKRILFDCIMMPPFHNGTSQYQLSLFEAFYRLYKDKYDIWLYTNREAAAFHRLTQFDNILYPDTIGDMVFHLGFAPNQLYFAETQIEMSKRCLKIVQTVLDTIALRCYEHLLGDIQFLNIMRMSFKLCDGIITISEYTKNDLTALYPDNDIPDTIPVKPILIAADNKKALEKSNDSIKTVPYERYFLVAGNRMKHKAIADIIPILKETKHNYIIVGAEKNRQIAKNIYGYSGGKLDESFLEQLYSGCMGLIFPSLYEGFGLPVITALGKNKTVIVADTEINRELCKKYRQYSDKFLFFSFFRQVAALTDEAASLTDTIKSVGAGMSEFRTWDDTALETEAFFTEILERDISVIKLTERRNMYNYIEDKLKSPIYIAPGHRAAKISSNAMKGLKNDLRNNHPKLFNTLKKLRNAFR